MPYVSREQHNGGHSKIVFRFVVNIEFLWFWVVMLVVMDGCEDQL